jgi:RHS repeat-associated protein
LLKKGRLRRAVVGVAFRRLDVDVRAGAVGYMPSRRPGMTIDHGYEAGYLTAIVSPPEENWLEEIRYHPNGLWSEIDRGNNWTDRQTVAGNGMQRPLELSTENGLGQQQYTTGTFAYDGAGNVKAMGADSFTYDAHNRLASARIDGDDYSYAYDAYGNLSDLPRPGEAVSICIDSQKNRIEETLPEGESCKLLADQDYFGNLVELQGFEYEYDPLDMPIHRNPEPVPPDHTYVYTADEERIWFINAGGGPPPGDGKTGLTAWEGLFLRDLDGTLLRQYSKETATPFVPADAVYTAPFTVSRDSIHRNGQLAVIREPGGVLRHQHLVHLGTPRAISAGNGALVSTHKYSPYGKELTGSSGNARQFTGHERDSHGAGESDNLDYMHTRFYSPYMGRFLSVDPVSLERPASAQTWNLYAYSVNNPLRCVDPDGQDFIDVVEGAFNAAGSNLAFGIGRSDPRNSDYELGQAIGDVISLGIGLYETAQGASAAGGGSLCTVGSGGTCSPLGVPLAAGGAAVAAHGAAVSLTAGGNLLALREGFTGGTSKTVGTAKVGRGSVKVDVEFPTGESTGNVHVQYKGKGGQQKIFLNSIEDFAKLPKSWRSSPRLRRAAEKALELLGRFRAPE